MKDEDDTVSPDAETVVDEKAVPVRPRLGRDPLDAAEKALAAAAQARGVPLELPSRTPPDRGDVFSAAERALAGARAARDRAAGGGPTPAEQRAREQLDRMKKGQPGPSDEGPSDTKGPRKRDL